ncbi:RuvX/YqgF family protein [Helicobacter sp. 13S00477-4]|uniref:RuvX/YqgF family protein n=1 Tax=Helicobacter sp. 13S00477-4 TaxID=1905759 RepID=UPI000BA6A8E3|nr:RuvX/YqgF family protein [Helicobacter sp. 13S00477-4]PAF52407.1 crossover junction endodeoxyribonuclease RuvA [Helicobacter sp. 13S00477-4]
MIIACDLGLKKIGLAGSINRIILPLEPIVRRNRRQASEELSDFLHLKNAHTLVVGLPIHNPGMSNRIRHFVGLVNFEGKIVYINEDYSSIEAFEDLLYMGRKKRREAQKNGQSDSLAACKILQRYFDDKRF